MERDFIDRLVAEVVSRLARELGADGSRERLVAVCSGTGGDVEQVARRMSGLVMQGFRLHFLFSENAAATYRAELEKKLQGLPWIETADTAQWHEVLGRADGVIAPLTGINTLSRLSMLLADTPHAHLLLSALTTGKPLFLVREGCAVLNNLQLNTALSERFTTVEQFGATVCAMSELSGAVTTCFSGSAKPNGNNTLPATEPSLLPQSVPHLRDRSSAGKSPRFLKGRVLTASHVSMAARGGYDLIHEQGAIVTPMARDLAAQKGVTLIQE